MRSGESSMASSCLYSIRLAASLTVFVGVVLTTTRGADDEDPGISDASAVVGHLFNFSILRSGKERTTLRYEVFEAGETTLPSWLSFDASSAALLGVPLQDDVRRIYVSVKKVFAAHKNNASTMEKDVFSIEVVESGKPSCASGTSDEMSLMSLVMDSPAPDEMNGIQRVNLLTAAADFLRIDVQRFELSDLKGQQSALDPDAVTAGPGDAHHRNAQSSASVILFTAGCKEQQQTDDDDDALISSIEKSAADGTLGDSLGYPVVGWQVIKSSSKRQKRYVTPYRGTPLLEMHATIFPKVTERFFERTTEATPQSRIIPTMVSPGISQPSLTHHHRHHHGQEQPLRRGKFPDPPDVTATPAWRYHALSTIPVQAGTPMPTPVLYPDRPTAIYGSPVVVIEDPTVKVPSSSHLPVDVMSRRYEITTDHATVDIGLTRTRFTVEPTKILPQSPNFKPTVNNRMKKLSLVCGKAWSYTVPKDTFLDLEDGNTRALKLMFTTSERTSIPASSWIQFDPENQLLYALPLLDNVGKHEYVLEAMDKEGASTFDRVELHVWPHPSFEFLSHTFSMTVRYNKWQYPVGIDWQTEILNRLALFFGDADNSRLVVLRVTLDPVRITWSNDSLSTSVCMFDEIKHTYDSLSTSDHHPTREMKKLMLPEFRVQEIAVNYKGACEGVVTSPMPTPNFSPKVNRPIRRLNVTVGDVLKYKIPEDTFYDFEDGNTRQLRLSLLTTSNLLPPKSHWVQFDARTQELIGIATKDDIGRQHYRLTAMDADGQDVVDTFEVHVQRLPLRKSPPVEFSIHLTHDFDDFVSDASKKTLVAFKIARLYGDISPQNVLVTSISKGSVVYAWSNKTLPTDICPKDQIDRLFSFLVNEHGGLTIGLVQVMGPEFRVTRADPVPLGICLTGIPPTFVTMTTTEPISSQVPDHPDATVKSVSTDDMYMTTVLPAAIITAVLLMTVILIVYCFYCRRRNAKEKVSDLDIDKEFVGGGVPVVFAGEVEETKPDPGKAPAIMQNEKPPLTTDYLLNPLRRGAAAVRESMAAASQLHQQQQQQQVQHQQPLHLQAETSPKVRDRRLPRHEQRKETQLYQPPPPFTTHGREVKSARPKAVKSTYSRHPTFVPP